MADIVKLLGLVLAMGVPTAGCSKVSEKLEERRQRAEEAVERTEEAMRRNEELLRWAEEGGDPPSSSPKEDSSASSTRATLQADTRAASTNEILQETANDLNKQAGTMLDEDTRMDRVSAGDHELVYHYTITETPLDLDAELVFDEHTQRSHLLEGVCSQMKPLVNRGVTLVFSYSVPKRKALHENRDPAVRLPSGSIGLAGGLR